MKIKKIRIEDLDKNINYLKHNLNQSLNFSSAIREILITSNRNLNFYGYCMYEKKILRGSILIIFQKEKDIKNNKENIFNLSTWYMDQNFRGAVAIKFMNHVINDLSPSIITDYTPNLASRNIHFLLRAKEMKCAKSSLSIIGYLNCLIKRKYFINPEVSEVDFPFLRSNFNNISFYKISNNAIKIRIKNKELYLILVEKIIFYPIYKWIKIPVKSVRIIWVSDNNLFAKNIDIIYFAMFKKYMAFHTYGYFDQIIDKSKLKFTKQFIDNDFRNFIFYGNKNSKFIYPIGSELSLKQV